MRLVVVLAVVLPVACRNAYVEPRPPILQPGAPGEPTRVIAAKDAVDLSQLRHTAAEIRFVQGMIPHHLQALSMAALVAARTSSEDIRLLATRIELSQADEIEMMREWLTARNTAPPTAEAQHAHEAAPMPGMLTAAEMRRLAAAEGAEFDRLFLEFMIQHHEGALTMVDELFSAAGAGQQSDIFAFASDVEADQRIEIDRMSAMLQERAK
jgi:uncharacterized protein (DUF305 family)